MALKIKEKALPAGEGLIAEWGLIVVVFLLAVVSFGLGRLSALEEVRPPVSIGQAEASPKPEALFIGGLVVASRSGSVYYFPWCSGAQKIAPTNQRWFEGEAQARQAGYSPAKGCKGLAN